MQEAFDALDVSTPKQVFDTTSNDHQRKLVDAAKRRVSIFATKPKVDSKRIFAWKP